VRHLLQTRRIAQPAASVQPSAYPLHPELIDLGKSRRQMNILGDCCRLWSWSCAWYSVQWRKFSRPSMTRSHVSHAKSGYGRAPSHRCMPSRSRVSLALPLSGGPHESKSDNTCMRSKFHHGHAHRVRLSVVRPFKYSTFPLSSQSVRRCYIAGVLRGSYKDE
jgi:hypothetical protein